MSVEISHKLLKYISKHTNVSIDDLTECVEKFNLKQERRKERKGKEEIKSDESDSTKSSDVEKVDSPKPVKKAKNETSSEDKLILSKYSDKSFYLRGEKTRSFKDELMKCGKWCKGLKVNKETVGGWIFSLKYLRTILQLLKEKEYEFDLKGFATLNLQQRKDGNHWDSATRFVFEREDDSDGNVIGVAEDLDEKITKLEDIDRYLMELIGFE